MRGWILVLPLYLFAEAGQPTYDLREEHTMDAERSYSSPSYQGNTPPNDAWHTSPNNNNYFDDPNWPNVRDEVGR